MQHKGLANDDTLPYLACETVAMACALKKTGGVKLAIGYFVILRICQNNICQFSV